jgi:uncharacterized cofD-like protein
MAVIQRIRELYRIISPGLGLKRWLVLSLVGLIQVIVGVALLLVDMLERARRRSLISFLTLRFLPREIRQLSAMAFFSTGVALAYVGWQRFSRSLMRVMLPEQPEAELSQVLLQRQRAERGRRVVVLGGGPGLLPVIRALQMLKEEVRIDVILTPTGEGRIVQELRNSFGLSGQQIIYATLDDAILYAELADGTLLEGAATINRSSAAQITNLFLSRDIRRVQVWESENNGKSATARLRDYMPAVSEAALDAINHAELIVFAPGRIYTHVLPSLTLPRLAQAVRESEASKVYFANLMTEPGKTDNWTVADHLETIQKLSGVVIDYAIVHQGSISPPMLQQYHNEGADVVRVESEEGDEVMSRLIFADTGEQTTLVEGAVIVSGDIITEAPQTVSFQRDGATVLREMPVVRHDPKKVAPLLRRLLSDKS